MKGQGTCQKAATAAECRSLAAALASGEGKKEGEAGFLPKGYTAKLTEQTATAAAASVNVANAMIAGGACGGPPAGARGGGEPTPLHLTLSARPPRANPEHSSRARTARASARCARVHIVLVFNLRAS